MSEHQRRVGAERSGDGFWAGLALPGVVWLCLFFLLPFYVILCVALGTVDPIFQTPPPEWNPLQWNTSAFEFVFDGLFTHGAAFQTVFVRTLRVRRRRDGPVAPHRLSGRVLRRALRRRWKGLLLVGLIAPFFISYLMRMLAWINLLQDDGWVNDVLVWVGILDAPRNWLDGRASSVILGLVYGYVPFMILPLYAFLDRIDRSLLEAARDLGASPFQAFRMVTLPLSMPAILAGIVIIALPMFGDYYTPDLLSGAPQTSIIGNQINLYIRGGQQIPVGAALVVVLMVFLDGPHELLHLRDRAGAAEARRMTRARTWLANPWGKPRFLVLFTALYLVWSIVPILIAIRFSFNEGRSRSTAQGWSFRWYTGDPDLSVLHDPDLRLALTQSLRLAAIAVIVTVPLGLALAVGLTRWRGRGSGTARGISLATLVTPEIVMGTALLLVFVHLLTFIQLGTVAQAIGHITFSLVFVVIIVRGRLLAIGPEYEEAARDLGASPHPGAAARAAADARSRDRGERDHRLRDLDGRLRHQRSSCRPGRPRTPSPCGSTPRVGPLRRPR